MRAAPRAVVFAGPTIAAGEAAAILPASYRPPVTQGDVYRAAVAGAATIAIVDGYFERLPAVWHKEILWAMSTGVEVWGCSSMGALRAAELHTFGMRGSGEIFAAFRDGRLEDDDEVAVAHALEEGGFAAASEALVNMRATVDAARREGVVDEQTAGRLIAAAKATFYPDRAWAPLLRSLAGELPAEVVETFRRWLPGGRVDQKRIDAREMLAALAAREPDRERPPPRYRLANTIAWNAARWSAGARAGGDGGHGGEQAHLASELADELRLTGAWDAATRAALLRLLATQAAARSGFEPAPDQIARAARDRPRAPADFLRAEACIDWLLGRAEQDLVAELTTFADELVAAKPLCRARAKAAQLADAARAGLDLPDGPRTLPELIAWYERAHGAACDERAFDDDERLTRALRRDHAFERAQRGKPAERAERLSGAAVGAGAAGRAGAAAIVSETLADNEIVTVRAAAPVAKQRADRVRLAPDAFLAAVPEARKAGRLWDAEIRTVALAGRLPAAAAGGWADASVELLGSERR